MKIILVTLILSLCAATGGITEGTVVRTPFKSLLHSVPWFHLRSLAKYSHKYQEDELLETIRDLSISKKKRLLFLSVLRDNEKLVELLVQSLSLENKDVIVLVKNAVMHKKYKSLPLLAGLNPFLAFNIILPSVKSDQALRVAKSISEESLREISAKSLKKLVKYMGAHKEIDLLFKVGLFNPVMAFGELVKTKDLEKISEFIFIGNFSLEDRKKIYKIVVDNYIFELIDTGLLEGLLEGLSFTDLEELEKYKLKNFDSQCEICMENYKERYFGCLESKRYGHGACKECYDAVMATRNPQCPWCRTSIPC